MACHMPQPRWAGPKRQNVSKPLYEQVRNSQAPAWVTQGRRRRFPTVATAYALIPSGTTLSALYNETRTLIPSVLIGGCGHNSGGDSNNNRRSSSHSMNERSYGNSGRAAGSQWTNYSPKSQHSPDNSARQLTLPSPQGYPFRLLSP